MKSEYYETIPSEDCLIFKFESVSAFRRVKKVIIYSPFRKYENTYNLALFDVLSNGSFSDLSVSNNLDMEKIFGTVVKSMLSFFAKNPAVSLYITGSTPARTRLYTIIILKELLEARKFFEIYGLNGNTKELFVPNHKYDAFLITYLNSAK